MATKKEKLRARMEKAVKANSKQRAIENKWYAEYGELYRTRQPVKQIKEFTEVQKQRRLESKRKRFRELKEKGGNRLGEYMICRHPDHVGLDRRVKNNHWSNSTGVCSACSVRDRKQADAFAYLRRVGMARDKLLDAIVEGKMGVGTLKDFYHSGLKMFGGIDGLVGCIKSEYDAADEGSQIRKQYLEMIVKVMVALSTMGQEDDLESLPDEEIHKRVLEMSREAAKLQN